MQAQCHHRDKYKEIAAKMYFSLCCNFFIYPYYLKNLDAPESHYFKIKIFCTQIR